MKFYPTRIAGAFRIELEKQMDERGFFARAWCEKEFRKHGLNPHLAQCSISYNARCRTLRGLHYQASPDEEAKIVRCLRGRVFDVLVDLRNDSTSRLQWESFELSAENGWALYIPEGVAHGFQTLEDHSELFYQMSVPYSPSSARTVSWRDERFNIPWPLSNPILSEKDRAA